MWIYYSYILTYEKTDRTAKYNDNYIELAIEKVRTTFDINISLNTVRQWDVAQVVNNLSGRNTKRVKRPVNLAISHHEHVDVIPPKNMLQLSETNLK